MSEPPLPDQPPAAVTHLVRERAEARAIHDWGRADALKAEIEAAGWKVVDHGTRTSVSRAAPPDREVGGEIRYGSARSAPSRLDEPPSSPFTVVVIAAESPGRLSRLLAGLRAYAPAGTQVVIVANDPDAEQETALAPGAPDRASIGGLEPLVLRTSTRLGYAASLNIGLRQAAGEVVLLADGGAVPTGDAFGPLAAALEDPAIAAAGGFGLAEPSVGRLEPGSLERSDAPAPIALEGAWLAFRRDDYLALGPLDERYVTPAWLDVWWSLRLRAGADNWQAEAEDEPDQPFDGDSHEAFASVAAEATAHALEIEAAPDAETAPAETDPTAPAEARPRSLARLELPLDADLPQWPPDRSRLNRRNMYRVLDRFGWRPDLIADGFPPDTRPGGDWHR